MGGGGGGGGGEECSIAFLSLSVGKGLCNYVQICCVCMHASGLV